MVGSRVSRRSLRALTLALVVVAALASIGAAAAWLPGHASWRWGGPPPTQDGPAVYLNLTIRAAPGTGLDQVSPANFTVPHGERVVLTVRNFDVGANPPALGWSHVMGTYYGTETVTYGTGSPTTVTWISPYEISHTLTILPWGGSFGGPMMNMSGPGVYGSGMMGTMVNLPIPAAANESTPAVVTASFYLSNPGTYSWYCEAPCDSAAMSTAGFMRGTVTVL